MHIASIGIDLGKTTFHLVALGERSKVLVRKKLSRTQPAGAHGESSALADWP
jgi:transposase